MKRLVDNNVLNKALNQENTYERIKSKIRNEKESEYSLSNNLIMLPKIDQKDSE